MGKTKRLGLTVPMVVCRVCGHKWVPRKDPRWCPKCHRRNMEEVVTVAGKEMAGTAGTAGYWASFNG